MEPDLIAPEARLLLSVIGQTPDAAAIVSLTSAPGFNWQRLLWLVQKEKAVSAVRDALRGARADLDDTGRAALDQLDRLAQVTEFRMARLEHLLAGALDTLAKQDIEVVLLKGAGLATTVYGSFAARPMYDLDLLAHRREAKRAWSALRDAGWMHDEKNHPPAFYESHHHLPPLADPQRTGLSIELHSAVSDGAVRLSGDMIREDARRLDFRGRRTLVPSPEHQVLHLATHFAWSHGFGAAAWRTFSDLHRIVCHSPLDWNTIVQDARDTGAATSCYWTFRLAGSLAGIDVTQDVLARLRPPRPEWVLRAVERHYTGVLFPFSPAACPSLRVTRMAWSMGMAPRWSGNGNARPWHREEVWATAQRDRTASSRPVGVFSRVASGAPQWRRYLTSLLTPAHGQQHSIAEVHRG